MIDVQLTDSTDGYEFQVTVREKGSATRHRVTMSEASYQDLSGGAASPERLIKAAFEFLLDHEPKESILSRFDVTVISQYFPSFEREIGRYL